MAVPFYMAGMEICMNKKKKKFVSYAKWGYIFLIPFFAVYIVFSLIPLISTFYNSFFENYMVGLMQVGPKFVGFDNYKAILFNGDTLLYLKNTMIMWLMGFIPQILISLLLASWFTDLRLRLKCTGFFKTIIYMPNLIMASAFAMLFYAIFADQGPINNMLNSMGLPTYRFLAEVAGARGLIALMNFLMWFGNTTIILMAAIMGVDPCLFEAARIDGASEFKIFHKIGIPMMGPGIATIAITTFIGSWNNYLMPLVLLFTPEKFTLPVMMASLKASTDMTANMGATYLAIAVSVVPIMIAFAFLSKYIISSISAGGVKE